MEVAKRDWIVFARMCHWYKAVGLISVLAHDAHPEAKDRKPASCKVLLFVQLTQKQQVVEISENEAQILGNKKKQLFVFGAE